MATFLLSNTLGPELFPLPLTCLLPFKICNMEPRLAKQSLRMTVIKWCIFQSSKVEPSGGAVLQMQCSCKLTYLVDRIQQRFPFSLELNEYCLLPLFVSARVPFFLLLASHPNVEIGINNNLPNVRSEETSLLPPASVLRPPPHPSPTENWPQRLLSWLTWVARKKGIVIESIFLCRVVTLRVEEEEPQLQLLRVLRGPALGKKRQSNSETFSFAGSKKDVIKLQSVKISSSAES